jgi:DNA processing protein
MTGGHDDDMTAVACDSCLRRTHLIAALSGRLDYEWRRREATARVLALPDEALLRIADSAARARYAAFDPAAARAAVTRAGLSAVCRCEPEYPDRMRDLADPPAVLHVAGTLRALAEPDAVAVVGARRASGYGLEVARSLGRGLSAAGVPVVSGLALGVDSAAHVGALESRAAPVAVLACGADVPYPASKRRLYAEVVRRGCVVSELPPGFGPLRWQFVARNRIIAALARVVVIVEAAERSGSLTTADFAAELGRTVAAVPGRITCRQAAGTNGLLQSGAPPVCGIADVLDLLADATGRPFHAASTPPPEPELEPPLRALLAAIEDGRDTLGALAATPDEARRVLAGLGELEFRGLIRRGFSGRYERAA